MALNIAVPLSGVGGLSPISPIDIDCWENIKILCSPIGSESSGVSSLDSEEAKQQSVQQQQQQQPLQQQLKEPSPPKTPEDLKILYNGRDILDLAYNVEPKNQKLWNLRYTYLPENNNIPMFLSNRSQYHRLGATGHIQEYSLAKCEDCDFQYPINSSSNFFCQTSVTYSPTTNSAMTYTGFSTINNNHHHQNNNNHRMNHQNINKKANNLYPNHINLTDNLFSNSFLKKTTNITNNSTTTTPTMSITPTSFTAATSPTSSGYSSSSSVGKYQSHNNNNLKTPTTPISNNNNLNSFYSFLNSFNNNGGGSNNAVNNNMNNNNTNNNGFYNNSAANTNSNYNNNFNNNNGFFNGQNYARMYKYF